MINLIKLKDYYINKNLNIIKKLIRFILILFINSTYTHFFIILKKRKKYKNYVKTNNSDNSNFYIFCITILNVDTPLLLGIVDKRKN